MKLKEKLNQAAGFTLVELIVVIAILAILAGVAVPVYSGYIEKANLVADRQLLSAANKAFAAACAQEGIDVNILTNAAGEHHAEMPVVDGKINVSGIQPASIQEAFAGFFAGNDGEFKVIEDLEFDDLTKLFVDPNIDSIHVLFAGGYLPLNGKDLENLKDSTFGTTMGMTALMTQMDGIVDQAAGLSSGKLGNVLTSADFNSCAMAALGFQPGEETAFAQKKADMIAELKSRAEAAGAPISDAEAEAQVAAAAAVVYAAQSSAGMSLSTAKSLFTGASQSVITDKMGAQKPGESAEAYAARYREAMAQTAIVCAMYTAYANQPGSTAEKNVTSGVVLSALANDANFRNYVNTTQGEKDLQAYLSSMNMMAGSSDGSNPAGVESLVLDGFASSGLGDILGGLVG